MADACSRRSFIQKYLFAVAAFVGVSLAGCNQNGSVRKADKNAKAVDPCNDLSGVSEKDIKSREKLGYVNESPIADMTCNKCNLWLPPGAGKQCGGCMLFNGPVYPSGYCTYWTARQT